MRTKGLTIPSYSSVEMSIECSHNCLVITELNLPQLHAVLGYFKEVDLICNMIFLSPWLCSSACISNISLTCFPVGPGGPVGPLAPLAPGPPAVPSGPWSPSGPGGPGGPVAPGSPSSPGGPESP